MTIYAAMRDRALAEFDEMVAEKEREIRFRMKASGASQFEIDTYLEGCRPGLTEQRAGIGRIVTLELMKAGVPLQGVSEDVLS